MVRSQCRSRVWPRQESDSTATYRPGGHQHQCVIPVDDGLNNGLLGAAKAGVTEGLLENVERSGHEAQYTVLPFTPTARLRGAADQPNLTVIDLQNSIRFAHAMTGSMQVAIEAAPSKTRRLPPSFLRSFSWKRLVLFF